MAHTTQYSCRQKIVPLQCLLNTCTAVALPCLALSFRYTQPSSVCSVPVSAPKHHDTVVVVLSTMVCMCDPWECPEETLTLFHVSLLRRPLRTSSHTLAACCRHGCSRHTCGVIRQATGRLVQGTFYWPCSGALRVLSWQGSQPFMPSLSSAGPVMTRMFRIL